MEVNLWQECLMRLKESVSQQEFSQWISPLQSSINDNGILLYAPNQYVLDSLLQKFKNIITKCIEDVSDGKIININFAVGTLKTSYEDYEQNITDPIKNQKTKIYKTNLNKSYFFENFVEGKSNVVALSAAKKVADLPGKSYNPLFIYGSIGLGKTHLIHSIGNHIIKNPEKEKVLYLHSERFVNEMIKAMQKNELNKFKNFYRNLNALLIDDIQFFSGKMRSQEELYHIFNFFLEENLQLIITSDRYPKSIKGIDERLRSRFGSGLTVAMQPPDLETRVSILLKKAEIFNINISVEVAFFIAKKIKSNVRELEGALKRVIANAQFTGTRISVGFVNEVLQDLLYVQNTLVSIDNIIQTVSEYFNIKESEILSKTRSRNVARPRQLAMALCKELTEHSLPEIGFAFGGRDHTTVLHACKQIGTLCKTENEVSEDFANLIRILSS